MEENRRCDLEVEVTDVEQSGKPTGSWLCCLPCYWLRRNSGFHKASLTIVTIVVTILLVASPVIFLISDIPGDETFDCEYKGVGCSRKNVAQVCEEELCSMTAKKILSSVSWKVDPCQHFSRFACGSRVKKNKFFKETRERSASDFETFKQNLDRLFQQLDVIPNNLTSFKKVGAFYQSCIRAGDRRVSLLPMFALLDKLGGYVDPTNDEPQDLSSLMLRLLRFNGAPLFDIYFNLSFQNFSTESPIIDLPLPFNFYSNFFSFKLEKTSRNESVNINRRFVPITEIIETEHWMKFKKYLSQSLNSKEGVFGENRDTIAKRILGGFFPGNISLSIKEEDTRKILLFANTITKVLKALIVWGQAPKTRLFIHIRDHELFSCFTIFESRFSQLMKSKVWFQGIGRKQSKQVREIERNIRDYQNRNYKKSNLTELQKNYPFVRWQYILEEFLNRRFSPADVLFIPASNYLISMQRILSRFSPRIVHNGLLLLFAMDTLYELVDGISFVDRPSFCTRITVGAFGEAASLLYLYSYGSEYLRRLQLGVNNIFRNLKEIFESKIKKWPWINEELKKEILQKTALFSVWFNKSVSWNITHFAVSLDDLKIEPENFFGNVIRRYRQLRVMPVGRFSKEYREDYFGVNSKSRSTSLLVPFELYFKENEPLYISYSTFGLFISEQLVEMLDFKKTINDSTGEVPFSKDSSTVSSKLPESALESCLQNQYSIFFSKRTDIVDAKNYAEFDEDSTIRQRGFEDSLYQYVVDLIILELAYLAWKNVANVEKERKLPEIELDAQQLFFLNVAQAYCHTATEESSVSEASLLTTFERIDVVFMNLPAFLKAYRCPSDPLMYKKSCFVW